MWQRTKRNVLLDGKPARRREVVLQMRLERGEAYCLVPCCTTKQAAHPHPHSSPSPSPNPNPNPDPDPDPDPNLNPNPNPKQAAPFCLRFFCSSAFELQLAPP